MVEFREGVFKNNHARNCCAIQLTEPLQKNPTMAQLQIVFTWNQDHLCQPVQDGSQTLKSFGIPVKTHGTSSNPQDWFWQKKITTRIHSPSLKANIFCMKTVHLGKIHCSLLKNQERQQEIECLIQAQTMYFFCDTHATGPGKNEVSTCMLRLYNYSGTPPYSSGPPFPEAYM